MTLRCGLEQLRRAAAEHRAIGGFTIYDVNAALAIVAAAGQAGTAVILQAGSSGFGVAGEAPLRALALAVAGYAMIDVGVHLDHSRDLDELRRAVDAGYTSVMIDGSHLAFAANIALTRQAMQCVEGSDTWLEAELGAIGGDEDRSTDARAASMTDPAQAKAFVDETGVHALAVAVGNVHGFTAEPARLDLDRLLAIRDVVWVPLVLHGASGLDPDDLRRAISEGGVAKVNVNAEIRRAYVAGLGRGHEACAPDDLVGMWSIAREEITAAASRVLAALDPLGGG
ncbi:MAG: class II fructose-bisphosphate aldolase [Ilumatobacteraceae bacterium]